MKKIISSFAGIVTLLAFATGCRNLTNGGLGEIMTPILPMPCSSPTVTITINPKSGGYEVINSQATAAGRNKDVEVSMNSAICFDNRSDRTVHVGITKSDDPDNESPFFVASNTSYNNSDYDVISLNSSGSSAAQQFPVRVDPSSSLSGKYYYEFVVVVEDSGTGADMLADKGNFANAKRPKIVVN